MTDEARKDKSYPQLSDEALQQVVGGTAPVVDVTVIPAPSAPVPIPYPTVGTSSDPVPGPVKRV